MKFKFGKDKLSDFVKVVQFMEKEGIAFEGMGDLGFTIGNETVENPQEGPIKTHPTLPIPEKVEDPDPLWRPARHDDKDCTDKEGCKDVTHYGAEPL